MVCLRNISVDTRHKGDTEDDDDDDDDDDVDDNNNNNNNNFLARLGTTKTGKPLPAYAVKQRNE